MELDMELLKTVEGRAQAYIDMREEETELYRKKALLLALAVLNDEIGTAASAFVTHKGEIETWGNVGVKWGSNINDAIEKESPLSAKWWRAILDCPDPDSARDIAHDEQLGSTQIRKRFGVVRNPAPSPPAYSGTAKVARYHAHVASFNLDLAEEEPELAEGDKVHLSVWRAK